MLDKFQGTAEVKEALVDNSDPGQEKQQLIKNVTDQEPVYPYKAQFLKRMKYAREWLDLGEVEMGMNKKLLQENSEH